MLATLCWPGAAQVSVDLREEASCSLCGDIGVEGSGGRRVMVWGVWRSIVHDFFGNRGVFVQL